MHSLAFLSRLARSSRVRWVIALMSSLRNRNQEESS
jgi:hypothetical protein